MGGTPTKNQKYIDAQTTLDLLEGGSDYGIFLLIATIDPENNILDKWSENRKKWFQEDRKMILTIFNSNVVSAMAGSSGSLIFHFAIPFSKENFKHFLTPFPVDFELTNYFTGFKGSISSLKNINKAFMASFSEETVIPFLDKESIKIKFYYTIVGIKLLDDLKQFELPGIPLKDQQVLLRAALLSGGDRFVLAFFSLPHDNKDPKFLSEEHMKQWKSLLGRNTLELLIKGNLKGNDPQFSSNMRLALEYFEEKAKKMEEEEKNEEVILDFDDNFKKTKDVNYPAFPNKHLDHFTEMETDIFWSALKIFLEKGRPEIYKSEKIFKKVIESWKKSNDSYKNYFNYSKLWEKHLYSIMETPFLFETVVLPIFTGDQPSFGFLRFLIDKNPEIIDFVWEKYLSQKMETPFLFETVVQPIFKGDKLCFEFLRFFMDKYPKIMDYLMKYKDQISFDFNDNSQTVQFLHNSIFTPEFRVIPLKMTTTYGCSHDVASVLKFENQYVGSKIGENKNLVVVAHSEGHTAFVATHVFYRVSQCSCTAPVTDILFLVSSEEPEKASLEKFFDLTFEKYDNGEIPEDEVLKPISFIHKNNWQNIGEITELKLKEPIKAIYMSFIFLKTGAVDQNLDLGWVGSLGFVNEQNFEKYKNLDLKRGLSRVLVP